MSTSRFGDFGFNPMRRTRVDRLADRLLDRLAYTDAQKREDRRRLAEVNGAIRSFQSGPQTEKTEQALERLRAENAELKQRLGA